ncbi:MAG: DUF1992 domain-containing protein [Chloroherpetonaceae bacterium]|nr:DUF1992 domain-containing protein [Chthonomonadaceae bacterium]MDW8208367.1 DUF1992 domain-containing protein [Chloroherpetonaceae bacterium]
MKPQEQGRGNYMEFDVIALIAERKIQEAMEQGKFDNLPGKGQPLRFTEDLQTPLHLRTAHRVLKNAGVLPEWMQAQRDLLADREQIRQLLEKTRQEYARRQQICATFPDAVRNFALWHARTRAEFLRLLKSVNTGILKLNLIAPATVDPGPPVRIETEMAAFDAAFPAPRGAGMDDAIAVQSGETWIRRVARERYMHSGKPADVQSWESGGSGKCI